MGRAGGVWPSRDDYQSAVLNPQRNLKDKRLHSTRVEMRKLGALEVPFPRSGNFGAVYKFTNGHQSFALKVFDKAQPDRELRYKLIDEHLERQTPSPNLVTFGYEDPGILVNGRWYPALVMDWVEGETLDHHLSKTLQERGQVDNRTLCQAWVELMLGLEKWRAAHGDLQHGNILVLPNEAMKLVDYDGMFVPAMSREGLTASEIGLPAYQHPKRYRGYFDERLDNFAGLVVLLSLAAMDAGRWQRYHTDDNCLIVREADLLRPEQSELFKELLSSNDPPVRKLAVILKAAARNGLDDIPQFSQLVADTTVRQALSPSWRPKPSPPPSVQVEQEIGQGANGRRITNREILSLLIRGDSDAQIARELSLSEQGVTKHINNLMNQVGVNSRRDLIIWAGMKGIKRAERGAQAAQSPKAQPAPTPQIRTPYPVVPKSSPAPAMFQNAQVTPKSVTLRGFLIILGLFLALVAVVMYVRSLNSGSGTGNYSQPAYTPTPYRTDPNVARPLGR